MNLIPDAVIRTAVLNRYIIYNLSAMSINKVYHIY